MAHDAARNGKKPARPLTFLRGFLRDPKAVGAVVPSSPRLIRKILDPVDVAKARVVVELGPGTGVLTAEILRRLGPAAKLFALEINPEFAETIRRDLPDPRLHVHSGAASDILAVLARAGEAHADLVVSGIPFSTMAREESHRTLERLKRALGPAGAFVAYQFTSSVRRLAEPILGAAETRRTLSTFPPMSIFIWRNGRVAAAR